MSRLVAVLVLTLFSGCGGCGRGDDQNTSDANTADAQPENITCETLQPVLTGTCSVEMNGTAKLIKGNVLTPTTVYTGGQVAIDMTGHITCVGGNCAQGGETVLTCPDAVISPGLINTHDHITFTQNLPYTDTGERYDDRQQWRKGLDSHTKITSGGGASADQIRW